MKKIITSTTLFAALFYTSVAFSETAEKPEYQDTINSCIKAWKNSPFKKDKEADKTITPGVKVFGIGKTNTDDLEATTAEQLVLVKPAVNVLGKTKLRLMNPKGWYCFKSNVSVLGKIEIETHCNAHFASAVEGAEVLAADDSSKGVVVLGSLRLEKDCGDQKTTKE
ncbi:MAG: hypothetical protein IT287_07520, partial [Bdellovibrionaceae bacterium]|nr:hypothetical protein [Pseudobdellovibrionaceae bacterium]